jgi:hypothetical protein
VEKSSEKSGKQPPFIFGSSLLTEGGDKTWDKQNDDGETKFIFGFTGTVLNDLIPYCS